MAHAWKACWGQPLEGSNPSSSATPRRALAAGVDQLTAPGVAAHPRAVGGFRLNLNPERGPGRDRGRVDGERDRRPLALVREDLPQDRAGTLREAETIRRQLPAETDEGRHTVSPERALQAARIVQLAGGDLDQTRGPGGDRPGRQLGPRAG